MRGRCVGLGELREQLGLLRGRHADAGIGHSKLDPVAPVHDLVYPQLDLALRGKLAGIAQEIEQDLPQPHGVDGERPELLLGFDHETVLVLLGELARGADYFVDQRRQFYGRGVELELRGPKRRRD